jgi:hypothetical protein
MMTKDKAGNPVFKRGTDYKVRSMFSPVWPVGQVSTCLETRQRRKGFESEDRVVEDGEGLFTVGDDTRWYTATEQFDVG